MKGAALAVLTPFLLAQTTRAFAPPPALPPRAPTALPAERPARAAAAASALLVGACLLAAPVVAGARGDVPPGTVAWPSVTVADIEQFALPSYDAAKGSNLIDLNAEVANVNKKTLATAKSRREAADASPEKKEADRLRKAEKDGGSLLQGLLGDAEAQNKQAIADEIAESRANRYKTF